MALITEEHKKFFNKGLKTGVNAFEAYYKKDYVLGQPLRIFSHNIIAILRKISFENYMKNPEEVGAAMGILLGIIGCRDAVTMIIRNDIYAELIRIFKNVRNKEIMDFDWAKMVKQLHEMFDELANSDSKLFQMCVSSMGLGNCVEAKKILYNVVLDGKKFLQHHGA